MGVEFANKVATLCCNHYKNKLNHHGKPRYPREWVPMAAIIIQKENESLMVVSMGTGSQCVGHSKLVLNADGTTEVLHDSHAEVIARRGLIRFLYNELHSVHNGKGSDVLEVCEDGRCKVKSGIRWHLFSTNTPCGDASIFPKDNPSDWGPKCRRRSAKRGLDDQLSQPAKHQRVSPDGISRNQTVSRCDQTTENGQPPSELANTTDEQSYHVIPDIHRTGAKCAPGGIQDPHGAGYKYHEIGALRTKPGRGDRSRSMACSDKLAKWTVLGIQGSLLTHFLCHPIYLHSVVIGHCPYSEIAMHRALIERVMGVQELPDGYRQMAPLLLQATIPFADGRESVEERLTEMADPKMALPAATAIVWYADGSSSGRQQVAVNGRRQGITAKNQHLPQARVCICKAELYKQFLQLVATVQRLPDSLRDKTVSSYFEHKKAARSYQTAWSQLQKIFNTWVKTFDMDKVNE